MSGVVQSLLSLPGGAALALLFVFTALEAPAFIGLVLPGELTLVLGGVLAHSGRISLAAAIAVGISGAIIGDSVGYWLGRRWRHLLLASPIGRCVKPARVQRAEAILNRRSGVTLFVGRLTAGARVLLRRRHTQPGGLADPHDASPVPRDSDDYYRSRTRS